MDDLRTHLRESRAAEWKAKEIHLGERTMRFDLRVFGKAVVGQRSLFISMHGGGSAPKATNDQQWHNQIMLYEPKEGVYVAPRAPTDSWDMLLQNADPKGYTNEVVIHEGKGHWMDREDAVALPWMAQYERRRRPERVVWFQDDVLHERFYWLGLPESARKVGGLTIAHIAGQKVIIEAGTTATTLTIFLDDDLLDLDRSVVLVRPNQKDQEAHL